MKNQKRLSETKFANQKPTVRKIPNVMRGPKHRIYRQFTQIANQENKLNLDFVQIAMLSSKTKAKDALQSPGQDDIPSSTRKLNHKLVRGSLKKQPTPG